MSNTMQPPVVPQRPRRSFAGPLVLIVLGAIFLLGNLNMLSWHKIGVWFSHYWPLLLILWGVVKLIEHYQAQRQGFRAAGIGVGGIFLVTIIVISGLVAHAVEQHWSGWREQINFDDGDFPNIFDQAHEFTDHLEQDFPAGATLKVIDNHGAVSVHPSDDNKITVAVRKKIRADNDEDAEKYNGQTKPTITVMGGLVTLDAKVDGAGDHSVETDLDISIPRKAPLSVISRHGDVNVVDRTGNVDISAQHGDTSVEDVTGNVKVNQEKGSAKIEQVTGDVHVQGRLDEVSLADVKGAAQLEGEFQESVKLERISKSVTFKSSRTDMEFSRIDGSLNLDSDELHAEQITGPLHLTTRSKNIRLDEVAGDVRLQDDNGAIEVGMRTVGNVQIDNKNGSLQLTLPDRAGFRVDAHTHDGEVQTDFPELKVDNNEHDGRASGSVGNGGAHIVLNNEHDGIEIRRTSAQPPHPPAPPSVSKPAKNLPAPPEDVQPTEN